MPRRFSFTKILLLLGILLLLVVVGDLIVRGFQRELVPPVWETPDREPEDGRRAIIRYGCGGCHVIPGIRHATGRVGPQLTGFRDQMYIAGVLPNVPENLVRWIQNPQHFNPQSAMPNLQISEEEARKIAAYLYANP
jgi:cytochrome c